MLIFSSKRQATDTRHRGARATRIADAERGQMLMVFALLIVPVTLVVGMVAVDASFWQSERRRAQSAADMAAMAAAKELPTNNDGLIIDTAREYTALNGYEHGADDIEITVDPNYAPNQVEVVVESPSVGLFSGIFGVFAPDHGARAVGEYAITDGLPAIFANDDNEDCDSDAIQISGNLNTIIGEVHSDSLFKLNGNNNEFNGPVEHGPDGDCEDISGSGNDFPQGGPSSSPNEDWPVEWRMIHTVGGGPVQNGWPSSTSANWMLENVKTGATTSCNVKRNGDTDISGQNLDAVYCVRGKAVLKAGSRGAATIAATGQIVAEKVGTLAQPFTAKWDNLLFYTSFNDSSALDAPDLGVIRGIIFVPNGRAKINGNSWTIFGSVVADQVHISGERNTIDSSSLGGQNLALRLVE
jgi:hypothetical protein